jgi:hypothetical protein
MSMYRTVTYEYESGGWKQAVRSNERMTLPAQPGRSESILVHKDLATCPDGE